MEGKKRRKEESFVGGEGVPGLGEGWLVAAVSPGPAVVPALPLPAVPPPLPAVPPPLPAVSPRPSPRTAWAPPLPLAAGEGAVALPVWAEEPAPDGG